MKRREKTVVFAVHHHIDQTPADGSLSAQSEFVSLASRDLQELMVIWTYISNVGKTSGNAVWTNRGLTRCGKETTTGGSVRS